MIYQNSFVDAYRPAEHAPPVALGFSSNGDIAFAKSGQLTYPEPKPKLYVFIFIDKILLRVVQSVDNYRVFQKGCTVFEVI